MHLPPSALTHLMPRQSCGRSYYRRFHSPKAGVGVSSIICEKLPFSRRLYPIVAACSSPQYRSITSNLYKKSLRMWSWSRQNIAPIKAGMSNKL
jgi:hypothetical protein